ncbi:TIGR03617 family F420-dependent LLM class oxidoreductase [Yinghuangia seranimata]|uniref:TIGR03617 family F420-dependent LLM class oxidoreductase n=1 Tax=Yinghuangia seranimata TaxID=408067 RepID=UPI00248D13FF|nr:TIGR03617 family F420-dependent LLM class oxidoreductase [Yinghuangia seranimata]MDI2126438.1 TIGR03617 family F420-dependent LLM class oxidoreductase [Yinghuangia seranimata]
MSDSGRAVPVDTLLDTPLHQAADRARALKDAGFDGVFTFEGPHDVFLPLVPAAAAGLDVMTNIAVAFPRSPVHLAHAAYDLHHASGGRFRLGLGTQIKAHIERRYGATWSQPVERMAETLRAVRTVLDCWQTGERLAFHGEFFDLTLMPPTLSPGPNPYGVPPLLAGGVGPRMLRMVAGTADGLLVHPFNTEAYLAGPLHTAVTAGLAEAGRARADLSVVLDVIVAAGRTEEEQAKALAGARAMVAFYGSTPAYRPVLDAEGYGDLQPELHALTKAGRWSDLPAAIDDTLLARLVAIGTPKQAAATLHHRIKASGADRLGFYLPYQADDQTVSEVLDALRG